MSKKELYGLYGILAHAVSDKITFDINDFSTKVNIQMIIKPG